MTKFERDMYDALNGNATEILKKRQTEIKNLTAEGKVCKNKFRMTCIAQEIIRLTNEYNAIDACI